jgi:phenylalanyl-tRNA synthetase alpha chain
MDEPAMRKRLQRIRDRLRKEIEVQEQRAIRSDEMRPDFPAKVLELLARPQLTSLPENPVGGTMETLRSVFTGFTEIDLPEIVDFAEARETIGDDALYVDPLELHRLDHDRILRYDLTLPLLMTVRYEGRPLRIFAAGKAYRLCQIDATHLDAFHQAEVLYVDERGHVDQWRVTAQILQAIDRMLPGRCVKIVPTQYTMCTQAWELEVEQDGRWFEVLAWGVFTDKIVKHLGADPAAHTAIGIGCGLERLAMLRYGIDDIRKIEVSSVA